MNPLTANNLEPRNSIRPLGNVASGVSARGKLAYALLAGALLAIGGGPAAAVETERAPIEAEALNGNAEAKAEKTAEENTQIDDEPSEPYDVFLPTEEISEDFAVPFPVDI